MSDPAPTIAETDQLDARLRDVLEVNGLELVERNHLDVEWVAKHSGEELFDALLETAAKVSDDGHLSAIIAVRLPDGIGYTLAVLKRSDASSEQPSSEQAS